LLDGPERFAGYAVEHPNESGLRDLGHHIYFSVIMPHGEKLGSGRVVVIPNVVVDHLEIPKEFAGTGVKRKQAVAEEVGAATVSAVEVVLGAGGGHVDNPAPCVHRNLAPTIGPAHSFPRVMGPGVVSQFARMRDGMKSPGQLTGAHVECPDISRSR